MLTQDTTRSQTASMIATSAKIFLSVIRSDFERTQEWSEVTGTDGTGHGRTFHPRATGIGSVRAPRRCAGAHTGFHLRPAQHSRSLHIPASSASASARWLRILARTSTLTSPPAEPSSPSQSSSSMSAGFSRPGTALARSCSCICFCATSASRSSWNRSWLSVSEPPDASRLVIRKSRRSTL